MQDEKNPDKPEVVEDQHCNKYWIDDKGRKHYILNAEPGGVEVTPEGG